jgi:predicted amidohydrolase YtcJ
MLQEGAAYSFEARHVPRPSREQWQAAILTGQSHLHSLGITGWQDAWVTPDTLEAYRGLAADGRLSARVVGALWWDRHRGLEQIITLGQRADLAVLDRNIFERGVLPADASVRYTVAAGRVVHEPTG